MGPGGSSGRILCNRTVARSIAVLGAGSWGTALAISLAQTGHEVCLWARRAEAAERMAAERHNPTYLPDVVIPDAVQITADLEAAVTDPEMWVMAAPSQSIRALAQRVRPHAHPDRIVVSVAKGIENDTLQTTTQVLADVLAPPVPVERIAVLSGPSHAEEVGEGRPTTLVAAAPDLAVAREVQETFMSPRLRVYATDDVMGVEIGGAVKNILAIAAGISDGVGYGDNAKAALVTRGLAEITRLGLALGAEPATFSGLAGLGDLVVTCFSRHSRNRYFGEQIGRGRTLEEVEEEMKMVAEGVKTTLSVRELAERHGVEMPITEAVHAILFRHLRPEDAVYELMTRAAKREDALAGFEE